MILERLVNVQYMTKLQVVFSYLVFFFLYPHDHILIYTYAVY